MLYNRKRDHKVYIVYYISLIASFIIKCVIILSNYYIVSHCYIIAICILYIIEKLY